MSQPELPPLPDDLSKLLGQLPDEVPPPGFEDRLLSAIGAAAAGGTVGAAAAAGAKAGAAGTTTAGAVTAGVAKYVVAAFVAGALAGGGAHAVLTPPKVVQVPVPVPVVVAPPAPPVPAEVEPVPAPAAQPAAARREPKPKPAPKPSHLAEERRLLDAARTALREGHPDRALTVLEQHPDDGELVEEREVLRIQALMSLQRVAEARLVAAEFRARYPASILLPVVDEAIREAR